MALIKSGLSANVFYNIAVMGTVRAAFFSNGINRIMLSDGVSSYEAGVDSPAAVATYSAKINGSLDESSNYYTDYVYRRSIHGVMGNGAGTSAVMTTGGSSEDGLRVTIAANTALQSGIDQIQAYRTLGAGTKMFYDGRKAYAGSQITYDHTIADSALGSTLPTTNNIPKSRPYLLQFGGHLHTAGSKTYDTGTVAVTNASTTITFTGAAITKGHVGAFFEIPAVGSKKYIIESVNVAAQTAVLTAAYEATTNATAAYSIHRDPLRTDWSNIDSSANILPESFPSANYERFQGGADGNEKIAGLARTNNQKIVFTNRTTWAQTKVSANAYRKTLLFPGIGLLNNRTTANDPNSGDLFWVSQNYQVMRTNGSSSYNLSRDFIGNILDGTHKGIHRNLIVDIDKTAGWHSVFYGHRGWYMLFVALSGSTYPNACLIFVDKLNPMGAVEGVSPWMLWTIPNALSSGLVMDSHKIQRPYIGDDLGFIWVMDSGTNDYGVDTTGYTTTGVITAADATSLTIDGATLYTAGSGLKGVKIRTYDAVTKELENDVVIQSNTTTKPTVTAWTVTPTVGDTCVIGGITMERYSKIYSDGSPERHKVAQSLYLTTDKAASSRNLTVHHFKDFSKIPENNPSGTVAGQDIDVNSGYTHKVLLRTRAKHHQIKVSNKFADEPITIGDIKRKVSLGGER